MKIRGGGPPGGPKQIKPESVKPKENNKDFAAVADQQGTTDAQKGAATAGAPHTSVHGTRQAAATNAVISPEKASALAAQIRNGQITRAQAAQRIAEQVAESQLGSQASQQAKDRLAEKLREVMENDPFLSRELNSLGAQD